MKCENLRDPGPKCVDADHWQLSGRLDHDPLVQLVEALDVAVHRPVVKDNWRDSLWKMVNRKLADRGDKNLRSWGLINARKTDHQIFWTTQKVPDGTVEMLKTVERRYSRNII